MLVKGGPRGQLHQTTRYRSMRPESFTPIASSPILWETNRAPIAVAHATKRDLVESATQSIRFMSVCDMALSDLKLEADMNLLIVP